ncbi:MAG TPA: isoaspartyl peptidase/L-asparaginase [Longimicrobiales bacterium]|nr:isoaspartyl peptidase/L-asparaginase [Longimicrobiales bacterium]
MRRTLLCLAAVLLAACAGSPPADQAPVPRPSPVPVPVPNWGMVIHGGAGTIARASLSPERERDYHAALEEALRAGHRVLADGGAALDAIEAAVRVMEDSPLFNAGKGAVFTHEGKNELDAAIMDGTGLRAGAIAGVTRVKNPISLARRVMEASPHVMLTGAGAERFASEQRLELVEESYFFTQSRWDALQRAKQAEARAPTGAGAVADEADRKFGTVGAVALDRQGRIAAGTSTGGTTNKRWGRVGDVPIIGGGTYANDRCAVSATGHGEYFIRNVVAYDICARMAYRGETLEQAAHHVVMEKLVAQQGEGGVIAMDAYGNYTMPFNSSGMYRGRIGSDGIPTTAIFRE